MERLEGTCGRQVGGQRNLMMTTFSPASDRSSCCPPIPPHQKQQCELAVTGASSSACVSNYLHPGGRDDTHASPPPSYLSPIDCTCTTPGPAPARMHACRLPPRPAPAPCRHVPAPVAMIAAYPWPRPALFLPPQANARSRAARSQSDHITSSSSPLHYIARPRSLSPRRS
jgi:hypothetical protein